MRNKINFVSGETYSLAEIFSGERRIIIPDLQRDYCWADTVHTEEKKELVSGFVMMLIGEYQMFQENNAMPASRGLIYGYESPENHIQLCDGQQRITTLFLLIGMLNRKVGDNSLRRFLITDFEYLQDDKEPYLQYSIRESSLYFLSDLVCHFFIKAENDKNHIKETSQIDQCAWFFNEYHEDPSILSMLNAVKIIDGLIQTKDLDWCRSFADFLLNKVTFMYYDLENRKNGEETFVVINTTGEPLSSVQNLKPIVMEAAINSSYKGDLAKDWEEIETWFWKKRLDKNGNDTADAGFTEFLRWVTILEAEDTISIRNILKEGKYTFPQERICFNDIKDYWNIIVFLFEQWSLSGRLSEEYLSPSINKDNGGRVIGQIDCFKLLPIIAYCKNWNVKDPNDRGLLRLYKFLENLTRKESILKDVNTIVDDAIKIARFNRNISVLSINPESSSISKIILSEEEILKLQILNKCADEETRDKTEEALWASQDYDQIPSHKIWAGEILPLIQWSLQDDGTFDLGLFDKYLNTFDNVFMGDCESNIDDIRRALIALQMPNYPRIFHGYTNYSFGWDWSDWKTLISENSLVFKSLFDRLINGESISGIIANCPNSIDYYDFVKCNYLLDYCEQKNIQKYDQDILLIRKKYATENNYISVLNMHLLKYLEIEAAQIGWAVNNIGNQVTVQKGSYLVKIGNKSKSEWLILLFKNNVEQSQHVLTITNDGTYKFPEVLNFLNTINAT